MPLRLPALLCASLLLAACCSDDDSSNGLVRVENATDLTIRIYYTTELDGCYIQQECRLPAGRSTWLDVTSVLWDGRITVEYQGMLEMYDLDFNVWDYDSVVVRPDDFPPVADG